MATKHADELTLRDRLSRLTFVQAAKMLGEGGAMLIHKGGKCEIEPDNVTLDDHQLRVKVPEATVTMTLSNDARKRLQWKCSACNSLCEHVGAVFSMVLEDKTFLGLAVPPPDESTPLELLSEEQLIERMLSERNERAADEKMTLKPLSPGVLWSDSLVTSAESGKTYRVALRGWERGEPTVPARISKPIH